MSKAINVFNYKWQDLQNDAKNLAAKIGIGKFKFILVVTNGGLIPAYFLANHLGIKTIKTLCLSSYKKDNIQGPIVHHAVEGFAEEIKNQRDWLVVDDLSDTGFTIEYIKRKYPAIKIAVLLQKQTGGIKADYYSREMPNIWIKLPYEK